MRKLCPFFPGHANNDDTVSNGDTEATAERPAEAMAIAGGVLRGQEAVTARQEAT